MSELVRSAAASPFLLQNQAAYRNWRVAKLADYPQGATDLVVEIRDPRHLSRAEHDELLRRIRKTNMAVYASDVGGEADKGIVLALGAALGLNRLDANWLADDDGITSLTINPAGPRPQYIPYTNRPISWHTDGYYNPPQRQIHGLLLHCVEPAARGGDNALLDPEIAYLLLRDEDPELIRALMQDDAMTIPPGTNSEGGYRASAVGPVFSIRPDGNLHMRYTARKRNIEWKNEPAVHAAVSRLRAICERDSPYIFRARLESGMGLVSNNVLHDRCGFDDLPDAPRRLIYRARYYDRVSRT
ncbi:TauD/TfdA family dioxygenase [Thiohalomonas denitrificans]|uniref:Taurine catabolism dioxygenase TauD, TfdA family n=1 Tax=Thiohalomonas denitrificans TaxID=415747 RepID=A0A1G5QJ75_9GAMM|nr:TauD/TfdA family dioxygenase [Thiohalomonas denitrificans]SCZ61668.1 Taurine catabolism dioxygenase TauD, TfdA family [Thiohalomonas denitrificans]